MRHLRLTAIIALSALMLGGCKKDDPVVENPEELITTVNYTLTALDQSPVTLTWRDLDGDGGDMPEITGGTLQSGIIYQGTLELLNETENPAEDVTEEIMEEDEEHQFFFATSDLLVISYADADVDGNPIGLSTTVTTGNPGAYELNIKLKHLPVKDAEGVSTGDITNAEGETEVDITFPIDVI